MNPDHKEQNQEERIIIKLQISLSSADGKRYVLIYDELKRYFGESCLSDETPEFRKQVEDLLQGRPKAYFYSSLRREDPIQEGKFVIEEEAPWQDW